MLPSRDAVRSWFPALDTDAAFLENAGGSQVPGVVADAVRDYMLQKYVQLGAGYPVSNEADAVVAEAHDFVEKWVGASGIGKVVLGASASVLTHLLAGAYADTLRSGDEIVIAETNHEANTGPWARLEKRGAKIRWWRVCPETQSLRIEDLAELVNSKTRIIAVAQVSNLLGEVVDMREVSRIAHAHGAKVVADGVAYAPHRAIDVAAWGVDWYVFSTYKVYGPHMAVLFGRNEAFAELEGPNHFFIRKEEIPYKFELGGVDHEGCAGLLALRPYFRFLAGEPDGANQDERETVVRAFNTITELENPLMIPLRRFLADDPNFHLIGPRSGDCVATVSFRHRTMPSQEISRRLQERRLWVRHGNMYAWRLCEALGIDPADGVVRVSAVHYNTPDEISRVLEALSGLQETA